VGAGGASIPRWLAERVGPTGRVVATDIEVGWIGDSLGPTVEVLRHDVALDDPPVGGFDLVHARLVLVHVPARDEALRRMVTALRPGGWLLLEDFDVTLQPLAHLDPHRPDHDLANKVRSGFCALLAQRGVDLEYGRKLPRLLAEQGLDAVRADAYMPVALEAAAALDASNVRQVREALIAQGHATDEEIERLLTALDQGLGVATPALISAWGRRPS
jgi:SAM-dependent methyltransferase